jgi:transposase
VFIDETGLNTKMARLRGRAPSGQRCVGSVPYGHWGSSTFIMALGYNGLSAPMLLPGAMDGPAFLAYVQQAPVLRPGQLVICDNLACHKIKGVRDAIQAVGADILYLPAYSPDLNPIEQAFSKLKAHLREAGARTYEAIQTALKHALDQFALSHCQNFILHANYSPR